MEKTVLEQKETYVDSVHRWGRIWGLTLLVLIVAYPIAVSLIFHAQINWPAFIKGFIAIGPMYWAVGIVEIFTYVPMLGAGGGYLAFITGNLINMKIPCAVNARDIVGAKTGTPENEIISTLSIATASLVTIVILALGVLLLIPLQPVLQSPALQPAFDNVVPALFGAMAYKYYRKNMKIALWPLVLMSVLFILVPGLLGSTSFMILPSGAIAIGVAYFRYRRSRKETAA